MSVDTAVPSAEPAAGGGSSRLPVALAETLALAIFATALWLGAQEFTGTFGVTIESRSCGSVWGLTTTDDLNALSCVGALRERLSLVATLVGVALALALAAPLALSPIAGPASTRRKIGFIGAVVLPLGVVIALIAVGRHLIWSISGA